MKQKIIDILDKHRETIHPMGQSAKWSQFIHYSEFDDIADQIEELYRTRDHCQLNRPIRVILVDKNNDPLKDII